MDRARGQDREYSREHLRKSQVVLKNVNQVDDGGALKQVAPTMVDSFVAPRRPGGVIGSVSDSGSVRQGVDAESIISIDNGALRIAPPLDPGWGREGICYGPYQRQGGLAFAVFMINGHNTSQSENLPETFRLRFNRWLVGPETFRRRQRIIQWLRSTRKLRTIRQWRWWRRIAKDAAPVPRVNENLAVGWFPSPTPGDPLISGNSLIMHATGAENGELWARVGASVLPAVRGVQNLQIYYVVVLRERGAAYYVSSVPDSHGLGCYPELRPVAIDPFCDDRELYAGVHQSTLGQIGFRLDTRVYGARIARLDEWASWYGSAACADTLRGSGPLPGTAAEASGSWSSPRGGFVRTPDGARSASEASEAIICAGQPIGLVHALIECGSEPPVTGLVWRHADGANHWRVDLDRRGVVLTRVVAGEATTVAHSKEPRLRPGATHSLQVLDDGRTISVHLDGTLVFGRRFEDDALASATGVGFATGGIGTEVVLRDFEAHPRACRLPASLDMGAPWHRMGERMIVAEDFEGPERDLDGKPTTTGSLTWNRTVGVGNFRVTGEGRARIVGSVSKPNPGRTAYTLDWEHPEFADLEVEITPAGTAMGQEEHGLCGFIFWQDPENYVTLNIWRYDTYDGASISTFFQIDGFEDLYDAIWANVGNRVYWGKPCRLRVVFDGMHYMAFVDGVPVMYRALTDVYPDARRLKINRVGLLANWEWGDDTGSTFRQFRARA